MRTSKCAEIGGSGPEDKLLKAFKKAANSWSPINKMGALADGALQAFHDRHPENLQILLSDPAIIGDKYYFPYGAFFVKALCEIMEKSVNGLADIDLALAKVPEEDRKGVLSQALYDVLNDRDKCTEPFVDLMLKAGAGVYAKIYGRDENMLCRAVTCGGSEAIIGLLLKAGAEPDAEINGQTESILFRAVQSGRPEAIIKYLYDNGASFEAALKQASSDDKKQLGSLMYYQEKFAEKPVAAQDEQSEVQQLRDEVLALRGRVDILTTRLEAALSSPKAEGVTAQQGRPAKLLVRQASAP